jgi:hypothetical protein
MMLQARWHLPALGRVAGQDTKATDDPALDFIEPDSAAEFRLVADPPFADDRRVRLKEADDFLPGRDVLPVADASSGLTDDTSGQFTEMVQLCSQFHRRAAGLTLEC